jgi:septal ring factor EnvC (AmiA/AmiB activator)
MESKRGEPKSVIMVRLPKWLHETLKMLAKDANMSLNEYCVGQLNPERIEEIWNLKNEATRLKSENDGLRAQSEALLTNQPFSS